MAVDRCDAPGTDGPTKLKRKMGSDSNGMHRSMTKWCVASPSAQLIVDPSSGARAIIRDTCADGAYRFHWSVIGGAGTFDGIVLSGIVAAYLAWFSSGRLDHPAVARTGRLESVDCLTGTKGSESVLLRQRVRSR
jgi:hypothetical protein